MTNKSKLRKEALGKRKSLSDQELIDFNNKLLNQFKTLDFSNIKTLHIFLPIIDKKEPNTFLLIDWLKNKYPKIQIVVPKADFDSNLMSNHIFTKKEDLITNHYNIPEPKGGDEFLDTPDMVIVPLLAFDKRGYRVGYGKGFYDRFLQDMNTQKIGLSFFDAVEEIIDVHLSDIRLDKCITQNGILEFNL